MSQRQSWIFAGLLMAFMVGVPFVHYRATYATHKRLRVVEDGKLYRSGCLTADGFEDAIKKYGIRTVLNLQEEAPDPDLPRSFWSYSSEKESDLCKRLGVRYEFLEVDLLDPARVPPERPKSLDAYAKLLSDPSAYPILIHCRAGLHRTGILVAIYRMERNGWTMRAAVDELRANGFGRMASHSPNEYIRQYLVHHEPRTASPFRLTGRER